MGIPISASQPPGLKTPGSDSIPASADGSPSARPSTGFKHKRTLIGLAVHGSGPPAAADEAETVIRGSEAPKEKPPEEDSPKAKSTEESPAEEVTPPAATSSSSEPETVIADLSARARDDKSELAAKPHAKKPEVPVSEAPISSIPMRGRSWRLPLTAAAVLGAGLIWSSLRKPASIPEPEPLAPVVVADNKPAPPEPAAAPPADPAPAHAEPAAAPVAATPEPTASVAPKPAPAAASAVATAEHKPPAAAVAAPTPPPKPSASAAPPRTGVTVVVVNSAPADASFFWKGKRIGTSPLRVELEPGEERAYEIVRPGYVTRRVFLDGSKTDIVAGMVASNPNPAPPAPKPTK